MKTQSELIIEVVSALYEYVTIREEATHDGKRPGLTWNKPDFIRTASCGAFRSWAIFAVYDRIAIAADGYQVRENRDHGGVLFIHVGDGEIRFPHNDSRTHNSLSLSVSSEEGKLVNVTKEDGPWTAHLPAMASKLRSATTSLQKAIIKYDQQIKDQRESQRCNDLTAAISAIAN